MIAYGVLTGAMAERRRRRVIERTSDDYIVGTEEELRAVEAVAG